MSKPKSSKRRMWFSFGRVITGLTLLCFFLPFFGISCDGQDVITISGADMAGGCKPGGLLAEAEEQAGDKGGDAASMGGEIKVDKVKREPLAIAALALAVLLFGASWLRTRGAMTGTMVLSAACLGACIGLWIKVGADLNTQVAEQGKKSSDSGLGGQMMKDSKVEAGPRMGLYAVCLGLVGGLVLCGLALKEPEGTEHATPPPPA